MHKRFFPHLFTTYFSQAIGALFGILVIKLIALYLTPEDLGVFFTGKRIVNLGWTTLNGPGKNLRWPTTKHEIL